MSDHARESAGGEKPLAVERSQRSQYATRDDTHDCDDHLIACLAYPVVVLPLLPIFPGGVDTTAVSGIACTLASIVCPITVWLLRIIRRKGIPVGTSVASMPVTWAALSTLAFLVFMNAFAWERVAKAPNGPHSLAASIISATSTLGTAVVLLTSYYLCPIHSRAGVTSDLEGQTPTSLTSPSLDSGSPSPHPSASSRSISPDNVCAKHTMSTLSFDPPPITAALSPGSVDSTKSTLEPTVSSEDPSNTNTHIMMTSANSSSSGFVEAHGQPPVLCDENTDNIV